MLSHYEQCNDEMLVHSIIGAMQLQAAKLDSGHTLLKAALRFLIHAKVQADGVRSRR